MAGVSGQSSDEAVLSEGRCWGRSRRMGDPAPAIMYDKAKDEAALVLCTSCCVDRYFCGALYLGLETGNWKGIFLDKSIYAKLREQNCTYHNYHIS